MFRLVNSIQDEEQEEMYVFLTKKASRVIGNALNVWGGSEEAAMNLYFSAFLMPAIGKKSPGFFNGISLFVSPDTVRPKFAEWAEKVNQYRKESGADDAVGVELVFRKISRMKEKMAEQNVYYTFDLFEEYLFALLLSSYNPRRFKKGEDPFVITTEEEIASDEETLRTKFGAMLDLYDDDGDEDEDYGYYGSDLDHVAWLARSVNRLEMMSIWASDESGHESLFFWDDDYSIIFQDSFVEGIRRLISGTAAVLGYSYEDVTEIFTDIGVKAPLLLTGSRTAFDEVNNLTWKKMNEAAKNWRLPAMAKEAGDLESLMEEVARHEDDPTYFFRKEEGGEKEEP